jgi:histidinol-phosphate/aromatic aminotransferase/cobyric acid decarboxylase-like protein
MTPMVPASVGDVVDRLTILNLKFERIDENDPRRAHVANERRHLQRALTEQCGFDLDTLFADGHVRELAEVNGKLWDVEDDIRRCLAEEDFGEEFVRLARAVPELNDRRSALKYEINRETGSEIVEVKSYVGFEV